MQKQSKAAIAQVRRDRLIWVTTTSSQRLHLPEVTTRLIVARFVHRSVDRSLTDSFISARLFIRFLSHLFDRPSGWKSWIYILLSSRSRTSARRKIVRLPLLSRLLRRVLRSTRGSERNSNDIGGLWAYQYDKSAFAWIIAVSATSGKLVASFIRGNQFLSR